MSVGDSNTNPDSIKSMPDDVNVDLRKEMAAYKAIGLEFNLTGYYASKLTPQEVTDANKAFDLLLDKFAPLKDLIKSVFDGVVVSLQTNTIKTAMNVTLAVTIVIVFLSTVLFLVTMYMNVVKNKWHALKCINKMLLVIKMLLAVILCLFATIFAVVCIVFSNACYFMFKASTEPSYTASVTDANIKNVFTTCILPGGDGDIRQFIGQGANSNRVGEFSDAMKFIVKSPEYGTLFDTGSAPPKGFSLQTKYQKNYECSEDDFSKVDQYSFAKAVTTINPTISISNNELALKGKCISKPAWDGTGYPNTKTYNSNSNFCLEVGNFPFAQSATVRYASPADGFATAVDATTANNNINNIHTQYDTYQTKYANWLNAYNTFYTTYEKPYYLDLQTSYFMMRDLKSKAVELSAFLDNFENSVLVATNCRVLSKEIKVLQVALCVNFARSLMNTTASMTGLGIVLFLFSYCMCCGIRYAPVRDTPRPNQVMHSSPDSEPLNSKRPIVQAETQQLLTKAPLS